MIYSMSTSFLRETGSTFYILLFVVQSNFNNFNLISSNFSFVWSKVKV